MRKFPDTVGQNAGLALDRYVPWPKNDDARREYLKRVADIRPADTYSTAYERWKGTFLTENRCALRVTATLGGPLAVGLGNESPLEAGLTLHRTYGIPWIPGSAVKGACLRAIQRLESAEREKALPLFGTTADAGYAIFHDAWFVPNSVNRPIMVDTVTVHHPNYYQSKGEKAFPTDFDDPVPVPFVSVRPGAEFLFAVEVPGASDDLLAFVEEMLRVTLTQIGLGGKTNAGYGWFTEIQAEKPAKVLTSEEQFAAAGARIAAFNASDLGQQALPLLQQAETLELRHLTAAALRERAQKIGRWNKDTVDKPWRKAIEEALG